MKQIIIDATGGMLGRVASFAAKQSLLGKTIKIVNCNDVLISGRRESIVEKYRSMRKKGGSSLKGPKFSKSSEKIMKRVVRGMLSHKQSRGRDALKRIKCYNALPREFESAEKISLKKELKVRSIKLSKLVEDL